MIHCFVVERARQVGKVDPRVAPALRQPLFRARQMVNVSAAETQRGRSVERLDPADVAKVVGLLRDAGLAALLGAGLALANHARQMVDFELEAAARVPAAVRVRARVLFLHLALVFGANVALFAASNPFVAIAADMPKSPKET